MKQTKEGYKENQQAHKTKEGTLVKFYLRPISIPIAKMFLIIGLTPNTVTIIGCFLWFFGGICLVFYDNLVIQVISAIFIHFGLILDVVDGSMARMSKQSNARGMYLDYISHLIVTPMIFILLGLNVYLTFKYFLFIFLSAFSAMVILDCALYAKEHILCVQIRKKKIDCLKENVIKSFYDRPENAKTIACDLKLNHPRSLVKNTFGIFKEIISFPGFFFTIPIAIILNIIVGKFMFLGIQINFILLVFLFHFIPLFFSFPNRIRRNFLILKRNIDVK